MQALHMIVRGRVQGVFYRDSAREKAVELGIIGFVRNLPDGSVEIFAQGRMKKLEELIAWCRKGPSLARVDNIEIGDAQPGIYEGFSIRY